MDNLKFGVLLSAIAGLVGCFLPLGAEGGTLFDLRDVDMFELVIVMGSFAVAALMAILAIARPPILRWQGIVAAAAFAGLLVRWRSVFIDMIKEGAIGAKLVAIAPIAGLLFAILSIAFAAPAVRRR